MALDPRSWLELLADGWWPARSREVVLGVGAPPGAPSGELAVWAWVDRNRLPAVDVAVRRSGSWVKSLVGGVRPTDEAVRWPGPVPLFAVAFTAASDSDRERLLAMAKGFSNLALSAPLEVRHPVEPSAGTLEPLPGGAGGFGPDLHPPPDWDAVRGAAAMATWSVPAVPLWLDVLCDALALKPAGLASRVGAPWWQDPPWRRSGEESPSGPLWPAIVEVLRAADLRESWRPLQVLEAIRDRTGSTDELGALFEETRAILNDERCIDPSRGGRDPLGAALQLVLLRPTPERFVTWKDELPSMTPVVWWTGATLSGLIRGYRDLDLRFKGLPSAQRLLALRTWQLGSSSWVRWPGFVEDGRAEWERRDGKVLLQWDGELWAERTEQTRGRWLAADLERNDVRRAAIALAQRLAPECVCQRVVVSDAQIHVTGPGRIGLDEQARRLAVTGEVSMALPGNARVAPDLDEVRFRAWLAQGGIAERLPEPPNAPPLAAEAGGGLFASGTPVAAPAPQEIPGLSLRPEFVTMEEERALLDKVDAEVWLEDLSRRVQHHGWRYNYKARTVSPTDWLGPLPEWAAELAARMVDQGIFEEVPDQVIVNEYLGKQGIAKHVDCERCFRGPIVTISLGESWEMVFHGPDGQKVVRTLPRRSAAAMVGEARHRWAHEIRKRKKEPWGVRGRRVSLTFRKVDQAPPSDKE